MTTYPSPQQQYYPTPQPAGARPGSVTALAIIGIVFGGIGVLCKPFSVVALFLPQPAPNPMVDMQKEMMAWNLANAGIGTLISILLLAAAIGALLLKAWARKGMLAYAGVAIVMNVVGLVVGLAYVVPRMRQAQEQMMQQQGGANLPPGMASIMQTAGAVGTVVWFILAMVFPVMVFYFFTRDNVKAAFEPGAGFPTGGPYGGGGYPAPYGGAYPGAPAGSYYAQPPPPAPPDSYPPPRS